MNEKIICVDPIEGYLTKNKEYEFQKIESYAGRAVIIDDTGREGHYKPERFTLYGENLDYVKDYYKVKLTRVSSSHQNLQRDEMMTRTGFLPVVGHCMFFSGDSLAQYMGPSVIQTTVLKEVSYDAETKTYTFKTRNTTYTAQYLNEGFSPEKEDV
jgi:hypothetical protein